MELCSVLEVAEKMGELKGGWFISRRMEAVKQLKSLLIVNRFQQLVFTWQHLRGCKG